MGLYRVIEQNPSVTHASLKSGIATRVPYIIFTTTDERKRAEFFPEIGISILDTCSVHIPFEFIFVHIKSIFLDVKFN